MKKYRKPEPGETVHCWMSGDKYIAHKDMLFLGPDKEAKDKLLVTDKKLGFNIITLSDLSQGNFRPLGRFNLVEENLNKKTKKHKSFTYSFFDNSKKILVTVVLYRGVWKIQEGFDAPSWMEKDDA